MAKRKTETKPANQEEAALVKLLKDLDNLGVQMVEADWRGLTDEQRNMAASWVNAKLAGGISQMPGYLERWVPDRAKVAAERQQYSEDQQTARRVTLPCTFLKPAVSSKDEDGNRRIKVSANIPFSSLRGGECDRLFRFKECRIEFSARSFDQWDGLPGTEAALPKITLVVADQSGYHASRHFTKFGFLIEERDDFTKDDAFDLEGCAGSLRIEVLGEASEKKTSDADADDDADPDQMTLPGTDATEPDATEFNVAESGDAFVNITLELIEGGWTSDLDQENAATAEPMQTMALPPRASQRDALSARLGQLIDQWSGIATDKDSKSVLKQLKHWLREVDSGKALDGIAAPVEA